MIGLPSNVVTTVANNTVTVRFIKGTNATKTEIDRFWVNGQGTFDAYTSYSSFYYDKLAWGTTYQFQLRSLNTAGEMAVDPTIYSFKTPDAIIPTIPQNVRTVVDKNTASITFTKGAGVKTEIDKFWVNGQETFDEYTTGNGFYYSGLTWGATYQFQLRTISNDGTVAVDPTIYSFKIEDEIIPVAPTNVNIIVFKNNAEIHFRKSAGIRTDIDKYWANSQGTWDESTATDEVFYVNNLPWGSYNTFKLRSVGNTGLTAETVEFSFDIEAEIVPTAPSNVSVEVYRNTATIHFTKGAGIKTEVDKYWVNSSGTWDEFTSDAGFYFENLAWGTHHEFKLRSVGNTGRTASDDVIYSFDIEPAIIPTPPTDVIFEVIKNVATITFAKGTGLRTEICKSWVNGIGVWDEYTSGNGFYYEDMPWGTHCQFKLRSTSNTGAVAETIVYEFDIEEAIMPTPCQALYADVYKNSAQVSFVRGEGEKAELIFSEGGIENVFDYTTGEAFFLESLEWGKHYDYFLRSVSNTGEYVDSEYSSFDIEEAIIPTPCLAITTSIYRNNIEIDFVRGEGEKVELIFLENGVESSYDYTTGEVFFENGLKWGKHYDFILRSVSNTGEYVDSEQSSFDIEPAVIPTAPINVIAMVDKNTLTINFMPGAGIKTEISKSWVDGLDIWNEYTSGSAFYYESMPWGSTCSFKLRSVSNTDEVVETEVYSVNIEPAIVPSLPTNVMVIVDDIQKNNVTINFTKGAGIKTEIDKFWVNGQDTYDEYTTGQGFLLENLPWGQNYKFKLRTVSNTSDVAVDPIIYSFDVVANPTPTAPSNVNLEVIDNTVTIRFDKGIGVKTEVDCYWVNGEGTFDEHTSGNAFYFEGLPFDSHLFFKLRTVSVGGQVAESQVYDFYTGIQG